MGEGRKTREGGHAASSSPRGLNAHGYPSVWFVSISISAGREEGMLERAVLHVAVGGGQGVNHHHLTESHPQNAVRSTGSVRSVKGKSSRLVQPQAAAMAWLDPLFTCCILTSMNAGTQLST